MKIVGKTSRIDKRTFLKAMGAGALGLLVYPYCKRTPKSKRTPSISEIKFEKGDTTDRVIDYTSLVAIDLSRKQDRYKSLKKIFHKKTETDKKFKTTKEKAETIITIHKNLITGRPTSIEIAEEGKEPVRIIALEVSGSTPIEYGALISYGYQGAIDRNGNNQPDSKDIKVLVIASPVITDPKDALKGLPTDEKGGWSPLTPLPKIDLMRIATGPRIAD